LSSRKSNRSDVTPLPMLDSTENKCVFYAITVVTCDSHLYLWERVWKKRV